MSFPFQSANRNRTIEFCMSNSAVNPIMSFYMKSKYSLFNNEILMKIQENWKKQISNAKKVLIIGVRPHFSDEHIWNPLINTKANVGFIGSNQGFAELKNKRDNHRVFRE